MEQVNSKENVEACLDLASMKSTPRLTSIPSSVRYVISSSCVNVNGSMFDDFLAEKFRR